MCIVYAFVGVVAFAAVVGVASMVLAAVLRVWLSTVLQTQMYSPREGVLVSANAHPYELEAPLTRGYANLSK
jgi:hypothetical protein